MTVACAFVGRVAPPVEKAQRSALFWMTSLTPQRHSCQVGGDNPMGGASLRSPTVASSYSLESPVELGLLLRERKREFPKRPSCYVER